MTAQVLNRIDGLSQIAPLRRLSTALCES